MLTTAHRTSNHHPVKRDKPRTARSRRLTGILIRFMPLTSIFRCCPVGAAAAGRGQPLEHSVLTGGPHARTHPMIARRRITNITEQIAGGLPAAFTAMLILATAACSAAAATPAAATAPASAASAMAPVPVLHWRSCYGG